jgi:hypothetical protein
MPEPKPNPLLQAVSAYKRQAGQRLRAEQLQEAVRLLKEVNRRLPSHNLLQASLEELKGAGARLFAEGESRDTSKFLSAELQRFFDVALEEGLISYHPITGAARIQDEADEQPKLSPQEAAAQAAALVAAVVEEGLQQGLMLSPLAMPLAEMDERRGLVDRLVSRLSGRWQTLAARMHLPLAVARVAIPLAAILLAVNGAMESGNPLASRYNTAVASGEAVRQLDLALNMVINQEGELGEISSLEELGDRVGVPLAKAAEVFELENAVREPPILYLRHKKSDTLVVITPGHRGALRRGVWRVLK